MCETNPSESPVTFRHIPCNSSFMKYLTKFQWLTLAMAALYIVSPVDMIPEILTGPFGLFILVLATALGLVPHFINLPRVYGMGCIMIPVMFYSFGIVV